ncbi:hypothetical protein DJ568_08960 [Mucilaginibacter hurinus]|uniref:Uncharacterized protein n=1 Tax=Mucilaginibacter hurinus TaxID=2201324 RepID=A0A367GP85_9SPHI|nr:hypothetical protein [Mucilaginibacter hurinus]RCH55302.1 hypothetical protein DJ568_08960 [Mucilaginibacter hurinus]
MQPIFITLLNGRQLMIIPDTLAHLNGHAILTYTYSIFLHDHHDEVHAAITKENALHLQQNDDPEYCGYLTFEKPDSLFTYVTDGQNELESDEIEEIIEELSHIRDFGAWKVKKRE